APGWESYPLHAWEAGLANNYTSTEISLWGALLPSIQLYSNACHWTGTGFNPGSTVDDFAFALSGLADFGTTLPTDIEVDGYSGKAVRLTVPDDVQVSTCDLGRYMSWDNRFYDAPGQTDDIRIVDLGSGVRHVYFATRYPATSIAVARQ